MTRKIKYIIVTALIAYMLTAIGIIKANEERGYKAYGGEYLIPIIVGIASSAIYDRKEILTILLPKREEEESGS